MQVISNLKKIAICVTSGLLLNACSSLVSVDDDVPPPPTAREARQLRIPADLAVNRTERSNGLLTVPSVVQSQKPGSKDFSASRGAVPVVISNVPLPVDSASFEGGGKNGIFFAPYIPFLKEGSEPAVWQKNPAYDFPWIPGAEPTRVNEETVVGSGEQMLGRLYAKKSYVREPENLKTEEIKIVSLEKEDAAEKKNKKSKNSKTVSLEPEIKKDTPKSKNSAELVVNCEGVTCLDLARDALVADAETKGWQMLLNRRVSLHQSFQFIRSGRVIWIELNSNGEKDLNIEYSLMPKQNVASKK